MRSNASAAGRCKGANAVAVFRVSSTARSITDDVSITSLDLTQPDATAPVPGAAATTTASGLTVSGDATSHDGVARFLSRLMLIPDLTNVTLSNSNAADGSVQFSISAGIKGAPVAPAPVTPPPAAATTTTDGSSS